MASNITLSAGVRQNLLALQNTASLLSSTQNRLATGKKVNSALDNPTNFFTSSALTSRASDLSSILDSMANGISTLKAADNGLTAITRAVESARATVNQARQDSSFKSTSYTVDANTIGIATTKYLTLSGGSVGTTAVNVALQANTGGTPVAATAASYAGGGLTPINFTNVAADAGTITNGAFGAALDFSDGAATQASLVGGANFTNIDLTANADNQFKFDVVSASGTTHITLTQADAGGDNIIDINEAVAAIHTQLAGSGVDVAAGTGGNAGKLVFSGVSPSTAGYATSLVTINSLAVQGTGVLANTTDLGFTNGDTDRGEDATIPVVSFQVAIDGGAATTVTINRAAVLAVGNNNTTLDSLAELVSIVDNQLGSNVTVDTNAGGLRLTSNTTGASSSVAISSYSLSGVTAHSVRAFTDTTGILQTNTSDNGQAASTPSISFDVTVDGGTAQTVTINQAAVAAVGDNDNIIDTGVELAAIIDAQLNASVTIAANGNGLNGGVTFTSATTGSSSRVQIQNLTATGVTNTTGIANNTDVSGTPASVTGGTNAVRTVDELVTAINTNTSLIGKVKASNDNGKLSIQNLSTEDLTLAGIGTTSGQIDGSAGTATVGGNTVRKNLIDQFNQLRTQLDKLADDSSFNGVNLLHGDTLKLVFNETNTSSISIVSQNANGISTSVLGIGTATAAEFSDNTALDARSDQLGVALTQLRSQASAFGSNLSIVQNRQDFTKAMITTLQVGSDNLTLADTNEEAANLLALQTRQQLSTTALSLANQAEQAVLRLF